MLIELKGILHISSNAKTIVELCHWLIDQVSTNLSWIDGMWPCVIWCLDCLQPSESRRGGMQGAEHAIWHRAWQNGPGGRRDATRSAVVDDWCWMDWAYGASRCRATRAISKDKTDIRTDGCRTYFSSLQLTACLTGLVGSHIHSTLHALGEIGGPMRSPPRTPLSTGLDSLCCLVKTS